MNKPVFPGKFEVQGEIAVGKTGTIYYGYDLELRQEVAIKIYHTHINGRLIRGKPFIEKAAPLLKLDHPNLIKIFKVEEDDGTPVVFMEFFDGPSLQQVIQEQGPLSVENTLVLSRGIAEVLVHTHFQGIIHGTLHPGHVLVGPQQHIKVMDLGLSWILMDILSDCDEDLLRPLHYLPPESARGELLSLGSDLYSLGFMMFEMLTCTTPYTNFPKTSIMGKLAFDKSDPSFHFPDSVPEGVRDFIRQLTRNDPQKRLKDATHALTIINQLLARLKPGTMPAAPLSGASRKPIQPDVSPKQKIDEPPSEPLTTDHTEEPVPPPVPSNTSQTAGIQRPSNQLNYFKKSRSSSKGYSGMIAGTLALVLAGGSLGYWFRDSLDPFRNPNPPTVSEEKPSVQPAAPDMSTAPTMVPVMTPSSSSPPPEKPVGGSSKSVNTALPQTAPRIENRTPKPFGEETPNQKITPPVDAPSTSPATPPASSTGTPVPKLKPLEMPPVPSPSMDQPSRKAIAEGEHSQTVPSSQPTPSRATPSPAAPTPAVPHGIGSPPTKSSVEDHPKQKVMGEEGSQSKSLTNPTIPASEASQAKVPQAGIIPPVKSPAAVPLTKESAPMDPATEKRMNPTPGIPPVTGPKALPPAPIGNPEAPIGILPPEQENAAPLKKTGFTETDILHDPATQELLNSVDALESVPVLTEDPIADTQQTP